ncbi:MAG: hypothetical protein ABI560_09205, partial [Myxococcales bacterium]
MSRRPNNTSSGVSSDQVLPASASASASAMGRTGGARGADQGELPPFGDADFHLLAEGTHARL